ncbi:hypothetical protein DL770_000764 [Monosporascus sp. CRB-9-2]|nr:hypothetical protein DL770_000764 [Monosporascus sp. CRB-9-2]
MATDESAPLLGKSPPSRKWSLFSLHNRILAAAFIISASFSYTQTPLLYVFRVMICEEYYRHAPPYDGEGDRCSRNEIDSGSAAQIAIMGTVSISFSITNLFVAGWQMRKMGPKMALALQIFFPVIRVCVQAASLLVGAKGGIIMMQASQAITILGGPAGYILILNTIIAEITEPAARTSMFGVLQGVTMVGVALGYFVGGWVAENLGIIRPFQLAAVSLSFSCLYCLLCIPYIHPNTISREKRETKPKGATALLGPLRSMAPQRLRLRDGRVVKHCGVMFLALGIFTGVLATGYAPTLLQMYSMTVFDFNPTNNSLLMAVNGLIRGVFLMFVFPQIISLGRRWFKTSSEPVALQPSSESPIPTHPQDFDPIPATVADAEPTKPPPPVAEVEGGAFDLFFLRWSLVLDGLITALAAFATRGWHIYLGSAPASKGVLTEMVPSSQRADALQAMTLIEYMATFSTLGIFGAIFSSLADLGKSYMTFYCNAAIAIVAVSILLLSSFPPPGSELVPDDVEEGHGSDEDERCS